MKNFSLYFINFLSLSTLLVLTGCETIPPGTAPEGPITSVSTVSDQKPISAKAAVNAMVTQLITSEFISGAEKTPTVMFIPEVYDKTSLINSTYAQKVNNLSMEVYSRLFHSNLIAPPPKINEFDYSLICITRQNPIFKDIPKGFTVFSWQLTALTNTKKPTTEWTYTLNVLIPKVSEKEVDPEVAKQLLKAKNAKEDKEQSS